MSTLDFFQGGPLYCRPSFFFLLFFFLGLHSVDPAHSATCKQEFFCSVQGIVETQTLCV